jgi:hypothetical protein
MTPEIAWMLIKIAAVIAGWLFYRQMVYGDNY